MTAVLQFLQIIIYSTTGDERGGPAEPSGGVAITGVLFGGRGHTLIRYPSVPLTNFPIQKLSNNLQTRVCERTRGFAPSSQQQAPTNILSRHVWFSLILPHDEHKLIYFSLWPVSWSSGQSFWLLIMRYRVRLPLLPWGFFLEREDFHGDHGLGSLVELRFKAPPRTSYSYHHHPPHRNNVPTPHGRPNLKSRLHFGHNREGETTKSISDMREGERERGRNSFASKAATVRKTYWNSG
jgi:hypothetical protein